MGAGRSAGIAVALAALGAACHSSRAQSPPGQEDSAWYDPHPLLVSLRPELQGGAAAAAGVDKLESLPLYDLDLDLDMVPGTFQLAEEIWLTNREAAPLADVVLRVYANEPHKSRSGDGASPPASLPAVQLLSGGCGGGATCTVASDGPSAIRVVPSSPLAPGKRLRIQLKLQGALETIDSSRTNLLAQGLEGLSSFGGGEGGGDYGLLARGDGIASFAAFYPVLARRVNGAWERADKSTMGDLGPDELSNVRAQVELPTAFKLASTGHVTSEESVPGAEPRRRVHVAAAMVRELSLLASDAWDRDERSQGGVTVRSYFLPAHKDAGERALDVATHALADFEKRFGPYPYADFDVCEAAIVGGAGGVEFSGLVTAASMFYKPPDEGGGLLSMLAQLSGGGGDPKAGQLGAGMLGGMMDGMLEFIVAHEVAHQWWHGLVGSDSREHPFLDEGLAQYSAGLYLQDRYGDARAARDGDMNVKMNYQMMRMMGGADGPVDRPVADFPSEIAYAGLVYGKGPYFYSALRKAIGDDAFFTALAGYVQRYRFRVAPAGAFVDQAAAGGNDAKVRALATHWLQESHGDEDLGKADLGALLGGLLGGGGDLGPMVQQLLGGVADAGAGKHGKPKKGGAKPAIDPDELLKQLLPQLGGMTQ